MRFGALEVVMLGIGAMLVYHVRDREDKRDRQVERLVAEERAFRARMPYVN